MSKAGVKGAFFSLRRRLPALFASNEGGQLITKAFNGGVMIRTRLTRLTGSKAPPAAPPPEGGIAAIAIDHGLISGLRPFGNGLRSTRFARALKARLTAFACFARLTIFAGLAMLLARLTWFTAFARLPVGAAITLAAMGFARGGLLTRGLVAFGLVLAAILVIAFIEIAGIAMLGFWARLQRLGGPQNAIIMLSVLQIIFCHDAIAGRCRIARQLQIALVDMRGRSTHFYIGAGALERAVRGVMVARFAATPALTLHIVLR